MFFIIIVFNFIVKKIVFVYNNIGDKNGIQNGSQK